MKKDFFGDSAIKYPAYEPWISKDDKKNCRESARTEYAYTRSAIRKI